MTLFETLAKATSEEDVKAAYIKALGLKDVRRNLIDIQTKEVWFEAKLGARHSTYSMFTQLLNYVWVALRDGEPVPPFLCVVDSVKAALMKTEVALPLLKDKSVRIKWGKSASDVTPEALEVISQFIGTHFVSFRLETQEREFIDTVKAAIRSGEIVRTQITPDNLKQVFDRWVEMVGRELSGVAAEDYALLFYADVMSDGTVSTHEHLPDLLSQLLGADWQRKFVVWDPCCGVGNLETKHSNPRNVFMSTLDQADVDVMKAAKTCRAATRFQYDYLNDDIADDGSIDYSITGKMPSELRAILGGERKNILVLMNPPYAEATNADNTAKGSKMENKTGVAKTRWAQRGMARYGRCSNELFAQFITRIAAEMPGAVVAMFSTMKHINAQTFENFRREWPAKFLGGFVVHSKAFDGIKGDFPIGFLVWQTGKETFPSSISCEVLDKSGRAIGEKTFWNIPNDRLLTNWIERPKPNTTPCIPLTNAIEPPKSARRDQRGTKWSDGAVAFLCTGTNDMQNTNYVYLLSSGASRGHGLFVNEENLAKAACLFSVQHLIAHTWVNHNDQFLIPDKELPEEFTLDCLVYMLFHGKNLTASADGLEWNGRKWSIVNHFIPFTEDEVNAPDRFESDFMVRYLEGRGLSPEASAVLAAVRDIWRTYFERFGLFDYSIRERLKLNRPDVGWYQIRQALKLYGESAEGRPADFTAFDAAYAALSAKLRPQVYGYGFLQQ